MIRFPHRSIAAMPALPAGMKSRWIHVLLLLLLAPLLAISPLLHAHPKSAQGPDHPSGIHLPAHTTAETVTENPCASPGQSATPDTPRLPTIVVPESRRRDRVVLVSTDAPAVFIGVSTPVFVSIPARVGPVAADASAPVPWTLWFAYQPLAPPQHA